MDYRCITCGYKMRLKVEYTSLSPKAIQGIRGLGQNTTQKAKRFKNLSTEVNDIKKAISELKTSFASSHIRNQAPNKLKKTRPTTR